MLGAGLSAVHDGVAAVQLEGVVEVGETLGSLAITAVRDPAECLHEHSRAQVSIGIPPVAGARGAARVHTVSMVTMHITCGMASFSRGYSTGWGIVTCSRRTGCTHTCHRAWPDPRGSAGARCHKEQVHRCPPEECQ